MALRWVASPVAGNRTGSVSGGEDIRVVLRMAPVEAVGDPAGDDARAWGEEVGDEEDDGGHQHDPRARRNARVVREVEAGDAAGGSGKTGHSSGDARSGRQQEQGRGHFGPSPHHAL